MPVTSKVRNQVRSRFPRTWNTARMLSKSIRLAPRLLGHYPRHCNLCGHQGKFLAEIHFPDIFVYDAVCPCCSSQPRNRLLMLAHERKEIVGGTEDMVHFAPERCLSPRLQLLARSYVTADLNPVGVDRQEDIEALSFDDASLDVVLCSHVLEHVDHHQALAELFRVLRPNGRLLALIPIVEGWARDYENPRINEGSLRGVHFGKDNHLRRFGRNVRDAFRAAGFAVEDFTVSGATTVKYGAHSGRSAVRGDQARALTMIRSRCRTGRATRNSPCASVHRRIGLRHGAHRRDRLAGVPRRERVFGHRVDLHVARVDRL